MASADLDGTGRREGEPVIYRWPWHWHLPRLGPWLLLALAVALPAANRDRRALPIFLPPLALVLLWPPAATRIGMHAIGIEEFGLVFESLVFAMALFWLNADKLARCHAGLWFVVGLGMLLLSGVAAGVAYGNPFSGSIAPFLLLALPPGILLFMILAATRRLVRGRYDPARFLLWMGVCSFLLSAVATMALAAVPTVSDELGYYGGEVLWAGLALGLGLYAINLPYMLLAFSSPFFQGRFRTWLGAESFPRPSEKALGISGS